MRPPLNWWVRRCMAAYWSARDPQLAAVESYAIGHAADEADYYERVEPRVTFKQTLIDQSRELRAERNAEGLAWAM